MIQGLIQIFTRPFPESKLNLLLGTPALPARGTGGDGAGVGPGAFLLLVRNSVHKPCKALKESLKATDIIEQSTEITATSSSSCSKESPTHTRRVWGEGWPKT